ncbi:protein phosphatase ppm-1.G-like isoform X2 [Gordionus sp. m RMFG-2023]|uniref:protein phosphatase ppm-1.G-like isoform X2 n=1 Tax=Gordionus sp. m RMFG-2023 TaxID=3053472 RepID=UPI0031FC8A6D
MGIYLSHPNINKDSLDIDYENYICGYSSMQGWRSSQEDAHNMIPDYEKDESLFAVYDGHGGSEVAKYTALHFPEFLQKLKKDYNYKNMECFLQKAFLMFDSKLKNPDIERELKKLAELSEGELELASNKSENDNLENINGSGDIQNPQNLKLKFKKLNNVPYVISPMISKKKNFDIINSKTSLDHTKETPLNGVEYCSTPIKNNLYKISQNLNIMSDTISQDIDTSKCDQPGPSSLSNNYSISESEISLEKDEALILKEEANIPVENLIEKYGEIIVEVKPTTTPSSNIPFSPLFSDHTRALLDLPIDNVNKDDGEEDTSDDDFQATFYSSDDSAVDINKKDSETSTSSSEEEPIEEDTTQEVESKTSIRCQQRKEGEIETKVVECKDVKKVCKLSREESILKPRGTKRKKVKEAKNVEKILKHDDNTTDILDAHPNENGDLIDQVDNIKSEIKSEITENLENKTKISETQEHSSKNVTEKLNDYEQELDEDDEDEDAGEEEDDDMIGDDEEASEERRNLLSNFMENSNQKPGYDSGCTAVVALLKKNDLYVANIGDSRCVISCEGKAHEMSLDHKPEDDLERKRIENAGGVVTEDGRVNEGLNLSRAFGDHNYKGEKELTDKEQMITAFPDVKHVKITNKHDFIVLACDGIWNSMSSQEVVDFIDERKDKYINNPSKICEELFDNCLAPNTGGDGTGCDNMTCVIVLLKKEYFTE